MEALLEWFKGLSLPPALNEVILLVLVLLLAFVANYITKKIILRLVNRLVRTTSTQWDDFLMKRGVFTLMSHLVPAIIIYYLAPTDLINMQLAAIIYMIIVGLLVVNAFLNSVVDIYRTFEFARRVPIRGFMQLIKIIIIIAAAIMILGMLVGRDPTKILAGFGAMTAVLMLIFKDAILGFVAGIQLSANNMVHMGDWIEMPKYGADGDVIDVSLTTVKVQNWDKTISTIPAYSLISDSFKNWRGMSESGGRRIKRSLNIDMNTVRFCDETMLNKFRRIQYLTEYIDSKKREIDEHNKAANIDDSELVNGRRMTNVGTFRAYVIAYLKNHPKINQDMTFLVRQLKSTEYGLPIEIYVFCNDKVWANYEGIQADIFDHILAVIPEFGLRVFQNPTGSDFGKLASTA